MENAPNIIFFLLKNNTCDSQINSKLQNLDLSNDIQFFSTNRIGFVFFEFELISQIIKKTNSQVWNILIHQDF
jgi:hypothetical protein